MMLTCEEKTYERLKQLILTENLPKGEFLPQRDRGNVRGEVFIRGRTAGIDSCGQQSDFDPFL